MDTPLGTITPLERYTILWDSMKDMKKVIVEGELKRDVYESELNKLKAASAIKQPNYTDAQNQKMVEMELAKYNGLVAGTTIALGYAEKAIVKLWDEHEEVRNSVKATNTHIGPL